MSMIDLDYFKNRWADFLGDPVNFIITNYPNLNLEQVIETNKTEISEDSNCALIQTRDKEYSILIVQPCPLLTKEEFNLLDGDLDWTFNSRLSKKYFDFLGYPKGVTGDILLWLVVNGLGEKFTPEILPSLMILIEDIAKLPVQSVCFLNNQTKAIIDDSSIRKLNTMCIYCGTGIEQKGLIFCSPQCKSDSTRKPNFLRLLSFDCPNHPNNQNKLPSYRTAYYTGAYQEYISEKPRKRKKYHEKLLEYTVHGAYDALMIKSDAIVSHIAEMWAKNSGKSISGKKQEYLDSKTEAFLVDKLKTLSQKYVIITNINEQFNSADFFCDNPEYSEEELQDAWIKFHDEYWDSDSKVFIYGLQDIDFSMLRKEFEEVDKTVRRDTPLINEQLIQSRIQEILDDRKKKTYHLPKPPSDHKWRSRAS